MKVVHTHRWLALLVAVIGLAALAGGIRTAVATTTASGHWVAGDLNTHTYLTDGKNTQADVLFQAFGNYGLDYIANAEPGGFSSVSPIGASYLAAIPRWTSLLEYSYPQVMYGRDAFPSKEIIQGLDWNVPGHDTVSVGIIGPEQPNAISNFEYLFDNADTDVSRVNEGTKAVTHVVYDASGNPTTVTDVPATPFTKQDGFQVDPVTGKLVLDAGGKPVPKDAAGKQADMLSAAQWLENNYSAASYAIVDHPSRSLAWTAKDLRQLADAAPDTVVGLEGIPGRQAAVARGGYSNNFTSAGVKTSDPAAIDPTVTAKARTYGGADYMVAKVGGVWDSLLSEGRHFWVFSNSDYAKWNSSINSGPAGPTQVVVGKDWYDYYPGQYNKTWTYMNGTGYDSLLAAISSGNSFIVDGDLINKLDFHATTGKKSSTMGQTLVAHKGQKLTITIRFRSPATNANGDKPIVNHIDLIRGWQRSKAAQFLPDGTTPNPTYAIDDVTASTAVTKRFTSKNWHVVKGWTTMTFTIKNPKKSMYFRLRGTNLGLNVANETSNGDPVVDTASYVTVHDPTFPNDQTKTVIGNTVDIPWTDLWFYSDPIFVKVK